jgi:hypothetical protein
MREVVGVQSAGGAAAGHYAGAVAVFECAAQPAADLAGGAAGADRLAVAFEPDLAGRVAQQVTTFVRGQQRTQMQRGDGLFDVDVDDDGGVLPVRAARCVGVPSGLDEAHERIDGVGERGCCFGRLPAFGVVVVGPLGDRRVAVGLEGGFELRGIEPG